MPRNGSGTYVAPANNWNPAVSTAEASAADWNDTLDDIEQALTASLSKDGQTTPSANLPMGTYKHTGVGNGSARTDYAAMGQVQDGKINWAGAGGTADAITATFSPAITALVDGQECSFRAGSANATTTPTFSPNSLAARTIVKNGGQALLAGDIAGAGHEVILRYDLDNTRWELLNPAGISEFVAADIGYDNADSGLTAENVQDAIDETVEMVEDFDEDLTVQETLFASLVSGLRGDVLYGLNLTNNVSDATNDIDIAAGSVVSDDGTTIMPLTAITKRVDAAWTVGTGNGGLDTGSVANTVYYVWVIYKPVIGANPAVTDILFSTSKTSPTMPTDYTKKALIGSFVRAGAANATAFWFNGRYTGALQSFTVGTPLVIPHGMGAAPVKVQTEFVCQTSNNGYSVDDVIIFETLYYQGELFSGAYNFGVLMAKDATNITINVSSSTALGTGLLIMPKGGGPTVSSAASNWRVRVIAEV